jgi:hypothetical protein
LSVDAPMPINKADIHFDARFFPSREKMDEYMLRDRGFDYLPFLTAQSHQKTNFVTNFDNTSADELTCHPYLEVDLFKLRENIKQGPVLAKQKAYDGSTHQYVFSTGLAYTGTTALYGLLSTSPKASNLCAAHGICCEGSWELMHHNLMDYHHKDDPNLPVDWNEAVKIFEKTWDLSKPVLLDKSPDYFHQTDRMVTSLTASGKNVSIIYLVRSPCAGKRPNYDPGVALMMETIGKLRALGARLHIVKYEELITDPYSVAERLLEFLPELESLDPSKSGLHDAPYVGPSDDRAKPLTEFIQSKAIGNHIMQKKDISITKSEEEYLKELGYTTTWWNSISVQN